MKFVETGITGAWLIEPEPFADHRGLFARTWSAEEFSQHGLNTEWIQCSASMNFVKGTLRGVHYQSSPFEEDKLVRVTRGSIFDVVVDLRPHSSQYGQWRGYELSADNRHALYIPKGCGHGFQSLEDNSEVYYQISAPYNAESARGVLWNDPDIGIDWPITPVQNLSDRDQQLPRFESLQES